LVKNGEIAYESRDRTVTPIKDNYGFASYFSGQEKREKILRIYEEFVKNNNIDRNLIVCFFGEWVGPRVQKNVAISELPDKKFFLFAIRVVSEERNDVDSYRFDQWFSIENIRDHSINFHNIKDHKTYNLEVDLNDIKPSISELQKIVDEVENECPVAKSFGISGLGEGVVWTIKYNNLVHRFKTKGKKHAVTVHKENACAVFDTEKMESIEEFVNSTVTEARLHQALERVFGEDIIPTRAETGSFIKWIVKDIVDEEIDMISNSGLSVRELTGPIAKKSQKWFFEYLEKIEKEKT
jgi:hypothetical protein